jgi:hypothetical protein
VVEFGPVGVGALNWDHDATIVLIVFTYLGRSAMLTYYMNHLVEFPHKTVMIDLVVLHNSH